MKVPFGKFRGVELEFLPDDYLSWLASIELRPRLEAAVRAEIMDRGIGVEAPTTRLVVPDAGIVQRIYRELAIEYHPDKARGNGDIMRGINIFRDRLRDACGS